MALTRIWQYFAFLSNMPHGVKSGSGSAMTAGSDDAVQTLQHEVQRLLGKCLLRLQQYELLMKVIVAHHDISGPVQSLNAIRATRLAETDRKTLGTLVGQLLGSYLVHDEVGTAVRAATDTFDDENSISLRIQLHLTPEDFARTEGGLRELVLLRNSLVHHFLDQHDLTTLKGCRGAQTTLNTACSRIEHHLDELRQWVEHLENTGRQLSDFVSSDGFHNLMVNGIASDGTVHWPLAGAVRALRDAATELAIDGWTAVAAAGSWIAARDPGQLPSKYGFSSWRQILHESRLFELRYIERGGQRAAWYREKESISNSA